MQKIEHIGIAVRDLPAAISLYKTLLQTDCYKTEEVASEQVQTAFFRVGESKIELVAATDPGSVISRFIDKKGEGLHHIAFEVPDIRAEMDRLKKAGFTLLNEEPKMGADNKLVCFVHPKDVTEVLVELCQSVG